MSPAPEDLPKDIKLALLKVSIWCRENGYEVKIFRAPRRIE